MALLGSFHQAFLGDFARSVPFRINELFLGDSAIRNDCGRKAGSFEPFPLKVDKITSKCQMFFDSFLTHPNMRMQQKLPRIQQTQTLHTVLPLISR